MIDPPDAPLGFATLSEEHRARIQAELEAGERLLWASRSGQRPNEVLSSPLGPGLLASISLAFVLVSIICGLGLLDTDRFVNRSFYGVLGSIAGMVSFCATFTALDAWAKRRNDRRESYRSLYALTDRRAVIWSPVRGTGVLEVFTIVADTLRAVHRVEYPDGRGDVRLGHYRKREENHDPSIPLGFIGIDAVRQVESMTREVLVAGPSPAGPATGLHGHGIHFPFDSDEPEEPF